MLFRQTHFDENPLTRKFKVIIRYMRTDPINPYETVSK